MINNRRNLISGLACLLTFASLVPSQAYAYIDPGTGSILLQGLIAAIAGIAVTGRLYWSRIKSALGIGKKNSVTDSSENAETIADELDRRSTRNILLAIGLGALALAIYLAFIMRT